jgi:formamidopyrimidine-DNA glycosylase
MPELPEVETVVRGLRRTILGRRIVSVTLRKTDFIDDPAAVERNLPGRRIDAVERFGKFMLLRLSREREEQNSGNSAFGPPALLVHLGMTGQIASIHASQPWEKHTHAGFALDDGRELRYTDARRFGRLAYLPEELLPAELKRFGADPLEVPVKEFVDQVQSRRSRIKAMLLDQTVLRGVGNIYADESLWKAKIHPARLGASLTSKQVRKLHDALQAILKKAILLRGSSISDYLDAEGEPGEYQGQHRAYGREGKPCSRCGAVVRRAIVAGRSSYFCPGCQPAPRGVSPLKLRKNPGRPSLLSTQKIKTTGKKMVSLRRRPSKRQRKI